MALFAQPPSSGNNNIIGNMNGYPSTSGSGTGTGSSTNTNGPEQLGTDGKSVLSSVPAWGSYLYQNFLLPAFSPSEWLNNNNTPMAPAAFNDYFGDSQTHQKWDTNPSVKVEPGLEYQQQQPQQAYSMNRSSTHPSFPPNTFSQNPYPSQLNRDNSSSFYPNQSYPYHDNFSQQSLAGPSMPTSVLLAQTRARGSDSTTQTLDVVDAQIRHSPSPPISSRQSPAKRHKRSRRASSLSSDEHELDLGAEVEVEVPEGVERDGMIWGMRVEDYRALSARERKRVRNRISARTFRAKRKEHLFSLESTLGAKDLQIKLANEESARLRREVLELKRRLSAYE